MEVENCVVQQNCVVIIIKRNLLYSCSRNVTRVEKVSFILHQTHYSKARLYLFCYMIVIYYICIEISLKHSTITFHCSVKIKFYFYTLKSIVLQAIVLCWYKKLFPRKLFSNSNCHLVKESEKQRNIKR